MSAQPDTLDIAYFIGLDLGQTNDPSAFTVLERQGSDPDTAVFLARSLKRYALRTSYPDIVDDVVARLKANPLRPRRGKTILEGKPTLGVDATGVGAPVVDLFRKKDELAAKLRPIQIVGGATITEDEEDDVTRVPKKHLVGAVQVALQTGRLKIAATLPESATLTTELKNFQMKITAAANETYGAWREGTHDDLVLAVAIALWLGMQSLPTPAPTALIARSGGAPPKVWLPGGRT